MSYGASCNRCLPPRRNYVVAFSKERNLVTFQLNCRQPSNSLSTLGPPKHWVNRASIAARSRGSSDAVMSAISTKRTWACALQMSAIGVKRTCHFALQMSAFDPKRTSTATYENA